MVKAESTGRRYVLLMAPDGRYVASFPDGLRLTDHGCDEACWLLDRSSSDGHAGPIIFHHPTTKVSMQGSTAELPAGTPAAEGIVTARGIDAAYTLRCPRPVPGQQPSPRGAAYIGAAAEALDAGPGATFVLMHGPDRMPSEYLGMLRETGYCVMPKLIASATINELREIFELDPSSRERFASPEGGPSSAVSAPAPFASSSEASAAAAQAPVTKVLTNPVVTWLAHEYMHEEELRLGGGPAIATLQPQQNADGRGGW